MALYGLKSSGSAFRSFLTARLDEMGFKSSIADPDLWIRHATKPYGEQYYKLILLYVDYLPVIRQDAVSVIRGVAEKFKLKKYKIETPEI